MATQEEDSFRKAIAKSEVNKSNSSLIIGEFFTIAIIAGLYWQSWLAFGGLLIIMVVALNSKSYSNIFVFVLSIAWAVVGFIIGKYIFESLIAGIVLIILFFVISIAIHQSGRQYFDDLGDGNTKASDYK